MQEPNVTIEISRRPKPKWYVNLADFANMVKAFIGSNYLYVAFAFLQSGLGLGIIGIVVIASLTDHCCHLLAVTKHHVISRCAEQASRQTTPRKGSYSTCRKSPETSDPTHTDDDDTMPFLDGTEEHNQSDFEIIDIEKLQEDMFRNMTYGDMGKLCFGRTGVGIVNFCIALTQFGFCVAYFIFIGNTIHSLFPEDLCYIAPGGNTTICTEVFMVTQSAGNHLAVDEILVNAITPTGIADTVTTSMPNMTTMSYSTGVTQPANATTPYAIIKQIVTKAPNLIYLVASPLPIFILFAFIRSVRYLGIISVVANFSILIGCVSLFGFLVHDFEVHASVVWFNWEGCPVFFGMVTAAFEGIGLVIPIESSMEDNRHLFSAFLHGALFILTMILGGFGILGYLKFGKNTAQMLNTNIPSGTGLSIAVNVGIMIGILLTFPLQLFPVVEILERYLFTVGGPCGVKKDRPDKEQEEETEQLMPSDQAPLLPDGHVASHIPSSIPSWKRNILRVLSVCFAAGLAILLRNMFAYVGAFVGAVGSSVLAFILPCLFHLKICWDDINMAVKVKDILIVVFGLVASVVGVYSVIVRIASGTLG